MDAEETGWVYAIGNPSFRDNLFKVGMSAQTDFDDRIDSLYTTGVPTPFNIVVIGKFKNPVQVEKNIHNILSHFRTRVNPNREFFECSEEDLILLFKTQYPCGDLIYNHNHEKPCAKEPRDYSIFEDGRRIRHVKNSDTLYGFWDEQNQCVRLESSPEINFESFSGFERYHMAQLEIETKGGANGWRNCEIETLPNNWVRASCYEKLKQ